MAPFIELRHSFVLHREVNSEKQATEDNETPSSTAAETSAAASGNTTVTHAEESETSANTQPTSVASVSSVGVTSTTKELTTSKVASVPSAKATVSSSKKETESVHSTANKAQKTSSPGVNNVGGSIPEVKTSSAASTSDTTSSRFEVAAAVAPTSAVNGAPKNSSGSDVTDDSAGSATATTGSPPENASASAGSVLPLPPQVSSGASSASDTLSSSGGILDTLIPTATAPPRRVGESSVPPSPSSLLSSLTSGITITSGGSAITPSPNGDLQFASSKVNMGAVIGGVIGGLLLLVFFTGLYLLGRRRRWLKAFEKDSWRVSRLEPPTPYVFGAPQNAGSNAMPPLPQQPPQLQVPGIPVVFVQDWSTVHLSPTASHPSELPYLASQPQMSQRA